MQQGAANYLTDGTRIGALKEVLDSQACRGNCGHPSSRTYPNLTVFERGSKKKHVLGQFKKRMECENKYSRYRRQHETEDPYRCLYKHLNGTDLCSEKWKKLSTSFVKTHSSFVVGEVQQEHNIKLYHVAVILNGRDFNNKTFNLNFPRSQTD